LAASRLNAGESKAWVCPRHLSVAPHPPFRSFLGPLGGMQGREELILRLREKKMWKCLKELSKDEQEEAHASNPQ
jgi:hypothetical protein